MKTRFLSSLQLASCFMVLSACGIQIDSTTESTADTAMSSQPNIKQSGSEILKKNRFHLITPTGEKIFASMKAWETGQVAQANTLAQPAMCASNASKVLEMSGINSYSSPLLMTMVNSVKKRGGLVMELPKNRSEIAKALKSVFNGRIPVGSFVSGCLRPDCSGQAGDGHIALVGDIDDAGYIKIYHNNWYRPDNNPEKKWYQHMIPMDWYNKGYRRKWMPTPWVYLQRDSAGLPLDIKVRLPEIDDLDPTNYYVTLTIPVEILNEVKANKGVVTDGKGGISNFVATDSSANKPCRSVRVSDPSDPNGVNMRSSPSGTILCSLSNGTRGELISREGLWTRVKAECNGKVSEGLVFSAFAESFCTQ